MKPNKMKILLLLLPILSGCAPRIIKCECTAPAPVLCPFNRPNIFDQYKGGTVPADYYYHTIITPTVGIPMGIP
jgi:hypothetical protein